MTIPKACKVFIVGLSQELGFPLYQFLKQQQVSVIASSRRVVEGTISLDLLDDINQLTLPRCDVAIICAGIAQLSRCEQFSEETFQLNVSKTIQLIERLAQQGTLIVYPSSTTVFDGKTPYLDITAAHAPQCEYGRQKALVENYLREHWKTQSLIMRINKIIQAKTSIIAAWCSKLKERAIITPFADMVIAPLSISVVSQIIMRLIEQDTRGIVHLTASSDISYADFARAIVKKNNLPLTLVQPITGISVPFKPQTAALNLRSLGELRQYIPETLDELLAELTIYPV